MKKLLCLLLPALLAGCSDKKEFEIEADLPGVGTQEMTVVYTLGDGNRAVRAVAAIDGKFSFVGECGDSADVEIFTANKRLLAAFGVRTGEKLALRAEGDSLMIDGREVLREFPQAAPADSLTFPELELLVAVDSVATIKPEGVWVFTSSVKERTPSVMDTMRAYDAGRVRDVYVSADERQWLRNCRADSAKWTCALMPDAPLTLAGILTSVPCLIEVDSVGTVVRVQRLE